MGHYSVKMRAARVGDPDQRKTHGHAMVLVGVHGSGLRRAGIDGDGIRRRLIADAQSGKLCGDSREAVALLQPDMTDACDGSGGACKGGDGSQGDGLIGAGGHIHCHAVEDTVSGRLHQQALPGLCHRTAHLHQNV